MNESLKGVDPANVVPEELAERYGFSREYSGFESGLELWGRSLEPEDAKKLRQVLGISRFTEQSFSPNPSITKTRVKITVQPARKRERDYGNRGRSGDYVQFSQTPPAFVKRSDKENLGIENLNKDIQDGEFLRQWYEKMRRERALNKVQSNPLNEISYECNSGESSRIPQVFRACYKRDNKPETEAWDRERRAQEWLRRGGDINGKMPAFPKDYNGVIPGLKDAREEEENRQWIKAGGYKAWKEFDDKYVPKSKRLFEAGIKYNWRTGKEGSGDTPWGSMDNLERYYVAYGALLGYGTYPPSYAKGYEKYNSYTDTYVKILSIYPKEGGEKYNYVVKAIVGFANKRKPAYDDKKMRAASAIDAALNDLGCDLASRRSMDYARGPIKMTPAPQEQFDLVNDVDGSTSTWLDGDRTDNKGRFTSTEVRPRGRDWR